MEKTKTFERESASAHDENASRAPMRPRIVVVWAADQSERRPVTADPTQAARLKS
jgi:hypothetical protein